MNVDRLDRTCHFTTEAGPAIFRVCDLRLAPLIHADHISGTDHLADSAADACLLVDMADHVLVPFEEIPPISSPPLWP